MGQCNAHTNARPSGVVPRRVGPKHRSRTHNQKKELFAASYAGARAY